MATLMPIPTNVPVEDKMELYRTIKLKGQKMEKIMRNI